MKPSLNWKKLTPEDVAEIRLRRVNAESVANLARAYNVRESTVWYHLRFGKAPTAQDSAYVRALAHATEARRLGDNKRAAEALNVAAMALSL